MALHNLNNENEVVPMVSQTTSTTTEPVDEEDCPTIDEVVTTDEVESDITKDYSTEQVVDNNTADFEHRFFLPDDERVAHETKVKLLESIIKFHENGTDEEVVKDHIIKTFDGLNNNPYKGILGKDGTGWYALYLLMKSCSDDVDKMKTLHRGLQTLCDIPRETGLAGLICPVFNLDWLYEQERTVEGFANRVFKLGVTVEASEASQVDQVYNDTINSATEVSKEALKEASRVSSSSSGGYSDSFDIWDVLKWGAVAAGVAGVGYLAYKGYQALTDNNTNDVVFIDMDDYDMEQPAFL